MPIYSSSRNRLTIILISFILLNVLFDDFGIRWSISIVVLFCLILFECLFQRRFPLENIPVIRNFAVFVISIVLLYLIFDSRKDLETASYMIVLLVCLFIVCFAKADRAQLIAAIRILIVAGVILAVYICLMKAFPNVYLAILDYLPQSIREYNTSLLSQGYGAAIGGSIVYADYMMSMVLIFLFGALLTRQEAKIIKSAHIWTVLALIVVVMLIAMLIEGRRGEPACLVLTLFLMGFTGFSKEPAPIKKKKAAVLCAAVVIVIVGFVVIKNVGSSSRFVTSTAEGITAGDVSNGRFHRWGLAWELFKTNPVFGFGWGRFGNYYSGKTDVLQVLNNFKFVHNDYLNVLCETGIVGFLLIYIPIFKIMSITLRQTRRLIGQKRLGTLGDPMQLVFSYFCLGGQLYWGILALIEPVLYKHMFLFYYTFLLICLKTANDNSSTHSF